MKHRGIVTILGVVLLVCLIASSGVGCAESVDREIVEMMKKTPANVSNFTFFDVKVLQGDDALNNLYEGWKIGFDYIVGSYGIDINNVHFSAITTAEQSGGYYFIKGDLNLAEIRNNLESLGFEKDEYLSVETWAKENEQIALMEELFIRGIALNVRECIDVIKGKKGSLWETENTKEMVDKLPDGANVNYLRQPEIMAYEGVKVQGISYEKKDKDTLQVTALFLYEDENAAGDAIPAIEADTGSDELISSDVEQDGKFVVVIIEIANEVMFGEE